MTEISRPTSQYTAIIQEFVIDFEYFSHKEIIADIYIILSWNWNKNCKSLQIISIF